MGKKRREISISKDDPKFSGCKENIHLRIYDRLLTLFR